VLALIMTYGFDTNKHGMDPADVEQECDPALAGSERDRPALPCVL
jgi:hypothetical protein